MTLHQTILTALEHRAIRYQNSQTYEELKDERLLNEVIVETGMVPCASEGGGKKSRLKVGKQVKKIRGVSEYLLEVHGSAPGRKKEGVTRLMYENLYGLQSTLSNKNKKLEKAWRVINDLQAKIVCYNKHWQNLRHKSNWNRFWHIFNGGETELRAIASHNKNKEARKFQEGGTAMIVYEDLIQQFNSEESGWDDLGLGQWMHMKFKGDNNISTRVICGYSPCANKKKDLGTVYQQHCWHLMNTLKDDSCPRAQFHNDLLHQLKRWRKDGERLILCMDANKNIYRGKLGQQLTDLYGLGMKEVVEEFSTKQLGLLTYWGANPLMPYGLPVM